MEMRANQQNKLSRFQVVCLQAIQTLRNGHGLQIHEEIERATGKSTPLGNMFTALHQLEESGCVRSEWGEEAETTPERALKGKKHYSITPDGEWELVQVGRQTTKP